MTEQFPPFDTFPTTALPVNPLTNFGNGGTEPRKRGPRRSSDIPGDSGNHMPPQKRKGGRPKKTKPAEPTPVEVQDPTLRLFNAAVGLQHEDLSPLTVAYQALLALPAGSRTRVLGILNRVFA